LMHLIGDFENMHNSFEFGDIIEIVKKDLNEKIQKAEELGVKNIIIDPGFGFSKTLDQNWALLQRLQELKSLNKEILVGVSRKRMIYQATGGTAETALIGTSIAHFIACQQGANILRVHDVQAAWDAINIYKATLHLTGKN
ncbi:MAG TPA: dihydropteroate synthase, partial [Bacteroidia bacterium]